MIQEKLGCVIFVRVSTTKQDVFGDSLDDQLNQINIAREKMALQYNCVIEVAKQFEFSESASVGIDTQPIQKALTYIRENKDKNVRFLFVKSLDRFIRTGAVMYGQLKVEFAKLGVTIIDTYGIVGSQEVNTLEHLGVKYKWSTFQPTFISELLEAERNKGEVRDIQTRMIGASIRYVRLGYWRGSILGILHKQVETSGDGKRLINIPHPTESLWIIKMFKMKTQGCTEEQIIESVNKLGFYTRKKSFHDKEKRSKVIRIRGGIKLSVKMLRSYLQKPIYAGVNTGKWLPEPVYLKGGGLVTIEDFNKANLGKVKIIDNNGKPSVIRGNVPDWQQKKLKLNPKFPYKQYILCPVCAHPLKGSSPKGKSKRIPTYHCSLHHKYWGINSNKLEETIRRFIMSVKFSDKFISKFESNFLKNWKIRMEQINKDTVSWEKRIIALRENKSVLEDKLKIVSTISAIKIVENESEEADRAIKLATVERSKAEDNEVDIQTLINTAKYWMEHFEELVLNTRDSIKRATLFGLIFEKLPNFEELKNGTPKLSPLFALSALSTKGGSLYSGIDETRTRNLFRDREAL